MEGVNYLNLVKINSYSQIFTCNFENSLNIQAIYWVALHVVDDFAPDSHLGYTGWGTHGFCSSEELHNLFYFFKWVQMQFLLHPHLSVQPYINHKKSSRLISILNFGSFWSFFTWQKSYSGVSQVLALKLMELLWKLLCREHVIDKMTSRQRQSVIIQKGDSKGELIRVTRLHSASSGKAFRF